jgi:hypothetical protein
MLGRRHDQSQLFQAVFFGREIRKVDLEGDVVHRGLEWLQAGVAGMAFAVEERENLRVPSVAIGELEESGPLESLDQLQADDLLIEELHGVEVFDAKSDLTQSLDWSVSCFHGKSLPIEARLELKTLPSS